MGGRGQKAGVLRFGAFELDLASGELRKGGALVKLQSQHFELLALLASRPGQVVSREEIREALWDSNTFVDFDRSINLGINQIRSALGDDPQSARYIETLPRKGYRFIAPLTEAGGQRATAVVRLALLTFSEAGLSRRRWLLSTAAVALVAIGVAVAIRESRERIAKPVESLAVLPLENLSHDPEQDYFAEGMTDELITDLAKISALRVISRTSVMQYKGTKKPVPRIARELNVDAVLEGTVTRDQDRVRITAQLIRAAPEKHLWAETYEARLSGVLTVQDTVAKAVAQAIQIKVTARERSLLATRREIDPAGYEAYLKGRYLWERPGEENLRKSREYFEQAIQKDPAYALAWAGLADALRRSATWGVLSFQDAFPRAKVAAEKALALDSTLAGPLVALGAVKMQYEWDWAGAERLYKQAIALSPNYGTAHHEYATYLAEVGRTQEAVAEARQAREVEPLSRMFAFNVTWKLYVARRYGEAELEFRRLSAWHPDSRGSIPLASVYLQTGRKREAIAELRKRVEDSDRGLFELMFLAHALGVSGARAEAKEILDEMRAPSPRRYVAPMYIAVVYEGLGEREQALQWFERACAERAINGWILRDPRLDQIRTEPRFKNLMRQMGLPQ
jgi:TolB-like protein/DNA-binding winged helix-turn-helix (wHTH) protein/Tfp pilus assembly protein PilF